MKSHCLPVQILLVLSSVLLSETVIAEPVATTADTRIPYALIVPEFSPPAAIVSKAVPPMSVSSAITVPSTKSRKLTIIRGEASTLPDLPVSPKPIPNVQRDLTPDEIEKIQFHRRHDLNVGATTINNRISIIHWHHPDTREYYEAVCGFDVGLLEGLGGFTHNGDSYSLMLMHSNIDTSGFCETFKDHFPDVPEVPADSIIILKGDSTDPIGTNTVTVLKDIIAAEKPRLIPYQAARRRHQEAVNAWEKAHPRIPRDQTFWFKPHRGSRYLETAAPGGAQ